MSGWTASPRCRVRPPSRRPLPVPAVVVALAAADDPAAASVNRVKARSRWRLRVSSEVAARVRPADLADAPVQPGAAPGSAAAAAGNTPGGLPPPARGAGGGGGFGGGPFVPGADAAYVVGSDGFLHALNVQNGVDLMPPTLFVPANTRAAGLLIATVPDGGSVAYAATTHGCGSQPDGVWAMELGVGQEGCRRVSTEGRDDCRQRRTDAGARRHASTSPRRLARLRCRTS